MTAMLDMASEIYNLLATSPDAAEKRARELFEVASDQGERDQINWARAYALVELRRFEQAKQIWSDIFHRTDDHKALHQVGYVQRCAGQIEDALKTYFAERRLISDSETLALAANLYELTYCNLLRGNKKEASRFLEEYERLDFENPDLVERGCFYRLKGDLLKDSNPCEAESAYLKSLNFFKEAQDEVGASELNDRLSQL